MRRRETDRVARRHERAVTTTQPTAVFPEGVSFDGAEVRFLDLGAGEVETIGFKLVESETGDIVNDAQYAVRSGVEEKLGVSLALKSSQKIDWQNKGAPVDTLRKSVYSGSDKYDIVVGYQAVTSNAASEGLLFDLNGVEHIDLKNSCWSEGADASMSYKNRYFWATGDITLSFTGGLCATFVNARLFDGISKDNLYKAVDDGKWTLDKLGSYAKLSYSDLNGSNTVDAEDAFGFAIHNQDPIDSLAYALGMKFVSFDGEGVLKLNFDVDKFTSIHDRIYKLLFESEGITFLSGYGDDKIMLKFNNGQMMFAINKIRHAGTTLRDMKDDFRILPLPKLNESQTDYLTTIHDGVNIYGVPTSCKNPGRSGAVPELMATKSEKLQAPAYYEMALKVKYSRDNDSGRMLDIIKAGVIDDFGNAYKETIKNSPAPALANLTRFTIENKEFASVIASYKMLYDAKFDELMASFEKNSK